MRIKDTADVVLERLALITQSNGYFTDMGGNIVSNQGKVLSEDEIFSDTVNFIDQGLKWESLNTAYVRTHAIACQFFVVSEQNKTLNDKIYDALDDVERFLLSIKTTGIGVGRSANIKMGEAKAMTWPHHENRDIALIELNLTFTYHIQGN